ncbi:hypothetical protein KDH83_14445 [Achromobacter sp. Marseille-Q0513]|nr:hypothetical protein [Achromobacter sp. Marseille-Q0513]MBR8654499.1 hypothetical protein [Achromobacter sp. Marseille-Q0513]
MFRKLGDKWQFEVAPLNWKAPDTGQHAEAAPASAETQGSERSDAQIDAN